MSIALAGQYSGILLVLVIVIACLRSAFIVLREGPQMRGHAMAAIGMAGAMASGWMAPPELARLLFLPFGMMLAAGGVLVVRATPGPLRGLHLFQILGGVGFVGLFFLR